MTIQKGNVYGVLGFPALIFKLADTKLKNFPFSPCHEQLLPTAQHRGRNTPTKQQGQKFLCRSITLCPGAAQQLWMCPWGTSQAQNGTRDSLLHQVFFSNLSSISPINSKKQEVQKLHFGRFMP